MNDQLSAYDISLLSDEELLQYSIEDLNDIFNQLVDEYNELNSEYIEGLDGDGDMYSPDWWDQYVYPVYLEKNRIQSIIDELENQKIVNKIIINNPETI